MKKILPFLILMVAVVCFGQQLSAQTTKKDSTQLFAVSGFGYGLNSGKINEVLKPQFSTNLGAEFRAKNNHFFVMAMLDLISYGYYQNTSDQAGNPYRIKYGSSTFYMFEVTPGYRVNFNKLSLYAFAGPGIGLTNLPNIEVNTQQLTATQVNKYSFTGSAEAGLGADMALGAGFNLFIQGKYMHNFNKVQNYSVNLFPVFVGFKSNISAVLGVFKKKAAPIVVVPAKF
ncbi:MAG: hypothetical protein EOP41_02035 [Sphingobacteriaceae bacterium]|nr:MAG: hypothetical protein EOP41_02035 [Sphingobacteriaceae bacterium]